MEARVKRTGSRTLLHATVGPGLSACDAQNHDKAVGDELHIRCIYSVHCPALQTASADKAAAWL